MIEVKNVQPTAREYRMVTQGWGALHWVAVLPVVVFPIGFLVFGLLALGETGDRFPPALMFLAFGVTTVIWMIANALLRDVAVRAMRRSPTGREDWNWRIDADGVVFENALQSNRLDWRGVMAVREEKDRFLFLVTPGHNPVQPMRLLTPEQKTELRALIAEVTASGRMGAGV
ncbi:YcxB family protein [Brevundimonas staleyi]|uniref:YcxB family protein n=1 Tax=Brevundimonas staleyi TaxID=74326 RepID=A0ABW0FSK9_9CAUL